MSKCIFFDADGTILDIKTGLAPDVPQAISRLVQNGHQVFLCTGRSRAFIPRELEKLPFTGMITNLGAYIEIAGKPVYQAEISQADTLRSIRILRENGLVPVMEGNQYMYYDIDEYTTDVDWYADLITDVLQERLMPITANEADIHINKISAKRRPGCNYKKACLELGDIFDFIYHEGAFVGSTIECIAKGHSKGLAIAVISTVLGIETKDIIAFGDSNNDLPMFALAGTKVAMGDASSDMLAAADYVTDTMANNGISKALKHLGLI